MITTLARPRTTGLTTLQAVKAGLKVDYDEDDGYLTDCIARASGAITRYTNRTWGRGVYRETVTDDGMVMLTHVPVLAVAQVLFNGASVSQWSVDDPEAGFLLTNTVAAGVYAWGSGGSLPTLDAHHNSRRRPYSVDYTAGFLLPQDDYTSNSISADASDNSLNDTLSRFPLLVPGDAFTIDGFHPSSNNGPAVVVSATASNIVVDGLTFETEASAESITLTVRNFPEEIEFACIEAIRAWYLERQWHLTGPRVIQAEGGTQFLNIPSGLLPKTAREALKPWTRVV